MASDAQWTVRVGQYVGAHHEKRDFEAHCRGNPEFRSVVITATLPWRRGLDEREEELRCVEIFFRAVRDMAKQDVLPIRR